MIVDISDALVENALVTFRRRQCVYLSAFQIFLNLRSFYHSDGMTLLGYRHLFHHVKGQLSRRNIVQRESFDFDDLLSVGRAVGIVLGSVGDVLFNVASVEFVCHSANKLAQGRIVHAIHVIVNYGICVAIQSARPQLFQVTVKLQSSVSGNVSCNHNVRVQCWRLKLFAFLYETYRQSSLIGCTSDT